MLLDGVPAAPSTSSWWRFDGSVHYLCAEMMDWDKLNVLLLVGHDSFSLFALLSIPMFALNDRVPQLLGCLAATLFMLLLLTYQGSVWRAVMFQTSEYGHSVLGKYGQADAIMVRRASHRALRRVRASHYSYGHHGTGAMARGAGRRCMLARAAVACESRSTLWLAGRLWCK